MPNMMPRNAPNVVPSLPKGKSGTNSKSNAGLSLKPPSGGGKGMPVLPSQTKK